MKILARRSSVMRLMGCTALSVGVIVGVGDTVGIAAAQQAAQRTVGIEEIMVTARKREEPLQQAPVAVTAIGGEDLRTRFPVDLKGLEFPAPNVNITRQGAFSNAAIVFIRGIGNSDNDSTVDPPVAIFIDGIYIPRPEDNSLDLFDVEQIEIMRGPQGTLFGRNTTAGAIQVRTRRPSGELGTRGRVTLGQFGRRDIRAAVDAPIVADKVDAKFAISSTHLDGYYRDIASNERLGEENSFSFRPMIRFQPNEQLEWTLIGEYSRTRSEATPQSQFASATQLMCTQWQICGMPFAATPDPFRVIEPDAPTDIDVNIWGITSDLNWTLDSGTITWLSNYRNTESLIKLDIDGTDAPVFATERDTDHEQYSTEARFASSAWDKFDFITGVFFFHQEFFLRRDTFQRLVPAASVLHIVGNTQQKHDSFSAFFEGNYRITDKLRANLGGRFTWERKSFFQEPFGVFPNAGPRITPDAKSWNNFGPKAGLDYQWTDDIMTYASYSRGFKSGGFNGRGGTASSLGPFGPEVVDAFEIGAKTDWLDRRLRVNLAAFYNEYDDLQRTVIRPLPGAPNPQETVTANAASAKIKGVELEVTAVPVEGFQIRSSLSYLDTKFGNFCADLDGGSFFADTPTSPCGGDVINTGTPGATGPGNYLVDVDNSGLPLQFAPEWQASITASYEHNLGDQGSVLLSGTYSYSGKANVTVSGLANGERPSISILDASITYTEAEGRYSISVFGKNLTKEIYLNSYVNVGPLFDVFTVSQPRRWGVELGWNF